MSARPPSRTQQSGEADATTGIEQEIRGEQAASLGRAGRLVERRLGALRDYRGAPEGRPPLVRAAAEAVQAYFIQREACGLRRHDSVIAELPIPRDVLLSLGAHQSRRGGD